MKTETPHSTEEKFLQTAAHDLRSPLVTITNLAQLLTLRYRGKLDPKAEEIIDMIATEALHADLVVKGLMEYLSYTPGTAEEIADQVDMHCALEKALTDLATMREETGAAITVTELPIVRARESDMVRVLLHLISNAIAFRGQAPCQIQVSSSIAENGSAVFCIRDNGLGFNPKFADEIFTPFKRLHGRSRGGSGLGLTLCKKILDQYGGRIWAESEEGKGSAFYFSLPSARIRLPADEPVHVTAGVV